jgi:tetratricopeptide (TPR) repeat protein
MGNTSKARQLLQTALDLDPHNGYVCHAYGLLEHTMGEHSKAKQLWQEGLVYQPSAALVCSLGEMYVASGDFHSARELYATYLPKLSNGRERTEVYLAAASLEERVYNDVEKASELLRRACAEGGGGGGGAEGGLMDGRAYVALARLGTSGGLVNDRVVKKRLKEICMRQLKHYEDNKEGLTNDNGGGGGGNERKTTKTKIIFPVTDGRLFNAWAKMESKSGNLSEARQILRQGIELYPRDYTLLQAAGNIEERMGNIGSARDLYAASLAIEPSAPTLIAYALLELRSPIDAKTSNITMVRKLFEEALMIDPKHGPAYNAFGNLERRQGNAEYARQIYENGIKANCTDAPSVYHGLAKLHLSLGEVEEARNVLQRGLALFPTSESNTLSPRNENVAFLAHTLAMIDLNVNNNAKHAKEVIQQGLWHCRNSPQLLLAMALCESRMGNENGAREMFERSLMADQTHAQAWQAFGVLEMRAGNFRSAKLLFECGLKNSPTHGALWQAYGELFYRARGDVIALRSDEVILSPSDR